MTHLLSLILCPPSHPRFPGPHSFASAFSVVMHYCSIYIQRCIFMAQKYRGPRAINTFAVAACAPLRNESRICSAIRRANFPLMRSPIRRSLLHTGGETCSPFLYIHRARYYIGNRFNRGEFTLNYLRWRTRNS